MPPTARIKHPPHPLLAAAAVLASNWIWPALADGGFACPQAIVSEQGKPLLRFVDLQAEPGMHHYAVATATEQANRDGWAKLEQAGKEYAAPAEAGWVYLVTARHGIDTLDGYRIERHDETRAAGFAQLPPPRELQPGHLDGLPADAEVCLLHL